MTSTLVTTLLPGTAGSMADGNIRVYSCTTTTNDYEVILTYPTLRATGNMHSFTVTTNDLLIKIEITRDNLIWYTLVEDYACAKGETTQVTYVTPALNTRVSVKPAVAATHGTVVWTNTVTEIIIDPAYRTAFAYEALTVTNAVAVGLTKATYDGAYVAMVTVEDNPIRVRYDGTSPTTTEGHYLSPGELIRLDFSIDIYKFKAIATAGNAKLRVTYSR